MPELLAALAVTDSTVEAQRQAVRRAIELPGVAPLVEHLRPELNRRGLL